MPTELKLFYVTIVCFCNSYYLVLTFSLRDSFCISDFYSLFPSLGKKNQCIFPQQPVAPWDLLSCPLALGERWFLSIPQMFGQLLPVYLCTQRVVDVHKQSNARPQRSTDYKILHGFHTLRFQTYGSNDLFPEYISIRTIHRSANQMLFVRLPTGMHRQHKHIFSI